LGGELLRIEISPRFASRSLLTSEIKEDRRYYNGKETTNMLSAPHIVVIAPNITA
jgi:hypothetical protein